MHFLADIPHRRAAARPSGGGRRSIAGTPGGRHNAFSFPSRPRSPMNPQPLAGRRVIELGTMIAAPFATHILSQLGAEVIKVEPPTGDTTRALVRGGPS